MAKTNKYIDQAGHIVVLANGKELGQGGRGHVYLATYENSTRIVAVKIFKGDYATPGCEKKLKHLLGIGKKSPGLAAAFPVAILYELKGKSERGAFAGYVMRHIEGVPLNRAASTLSLEGRIAVCSAMENIVSHMHKCACVIGDIRLENFVLGKDGKLYLVDIDSCCVYDRQNAICYPANATLFYSLEMIDKVRQNKSLTRIHLTPQSDYFLLAHALFMVLFGASPFDGGPHTQGMGWADAINYNIGKRAYVNRTKVGMLPTNFYSDELCRLFERSFSSAPADALPSCKDYARAIKNCKSTTGGKLYRICPHCNLKQPLKMGCVCPGCAA